jgi:tRNA U34 5-carboxymethylaminomethyl modifying enzyme MnmG/GidA
LRNLKVYQLKLMKNFDVIVIGGGHAGVEAALAAAFDGGGKAE